VIHFVKTQWGFYQAFVLFKMLTEEKFSLKSIDLNVMTNDLRRKNTQ